ncbi:MAG: NUDIX domain-containing protein, partial [Gemmatimonadetes bacterium]|nr:NUDIX domain-containing protein [Gemmatimonadota bacterium]NIQ54965.1 NUDIX domain-containing protein [Gemmatimonadota bacterium]NIU75164.1 NUDIX domain-containing protein [Gammaproteobacteria bacterium]NIX44987.1 NUDIX domain-containing protein [Gemmatimonadota bacterium]
DVGGGLIEYEYDHLFVGRWSGRPEPDPAEVADWRWVSVEELENEVALHPRRFTYWFRVALLELRSEGRLPDRVHRVA